MCALHGAIYCLLCAGILSCQQRPLPNLPAHLQHSNASTGLIDFSGKWKITDLSLALTSRLTASHSGLTLAALGGGSCCFLNYRRRIFEPNILLLSPTDGQCYREKGWVWEDVSCRDYVRVKYVLIPPTQRNCIRVHWLFCLIVSADFGVKTNAGLRLK